MKRIFLKTAAMACLLVGVSACSTDFLEEKKDYAKLGPTDIYSDPTQANAVFATIYKQLFEATTPAQTISPLLRQGGNFANMGEFHKLSEEFTASTGDNTLNGDNAKQTKAGNIFGNPTFWNYGKNSPGSFNAFAKSTLFPTIYHINNLITEIDRSGRQLYNDPVFWDGLKGQAIFMRAWLQFDGLRYLGAPPYYPTETDPTPPDDHSLRMPVPQFIEKICTDFETAAALLPAKWDDAEDFGRFTSAAAWAMLSRVRLYAASPVFNASWDNPDGTRWQLALNASLKADSAARADGYGTLTGIDAWDAAFYNYEGKFNPEGIIVLQKGNSTTIEESTWGSWDNSIRFGVVSGETGGGMPATEETMAKFPMANGLRATEANGYDDLKFYRNRDPRFYRTFTMLRSDWEIPNANPYMLYAYLMKDSVTTGKTFSPMEYRYTDGTTGDGAKGRSRANVWKMSDPGAPRSGTRAGTDIMVYRYAEILLNIAECYAAQGNAGKTKEYLQIIRNRVGAGTDDFAALSDRYELIEAVLNERAVEFAYEGIRAVDMRRWLLWEGGAGFDPLQAPGFDSKNNSYDPDLAWGIGWKLYNGKDGRPTYTKTDNVLTRLGLEPFSGKRHTNKIWFYDMGVVHSEMDGSLSVAPLSESAALAAVGPLTRSMTEAQRNEVFDEWEAFLETEEGQKMQLIDPGTEIGVNREYAMDSGGGGADAKPYNFRIGFRGWYYLYPIHYDMYDPSKGNDWMTQTEGWMIANAAPSASINSEEQNGTYVYCTPE